MRLIDVFVLYVEVVEAIASAAKVLVPLLLGVAALAAGIRRAPRRRRTTRPDTSGQDPDSPPDIPALLPSPEP